MDEGIIKNLMTSMECSSCGQSYQVDNIEVMGHHEDLWFLGISCSVCQTQYLVVAIITEERVPEIITDLTKAELDKFGGAGKLTADDVLDIHGFLKGFDGDFSRLFSKK